MRLIITGAAAALLLALAACGPQGGEQATEQGGGPAAIDEEVDREADFNELPPVAAELLAVPNEQFTAIEPSELEVQADGAILDALAPLLGPEMTQAGESLNVSIRESGDEAVADIVRANIMSDVVAAGHLRIEFRREPEGWFPTNAYRRFLCRRGEAMQWSSGACE